MFYGQYVVSMTKNDKFLLPAAFRKHLQANRTGKTYSIAVVLGDGCLCAYEEAAFFATLKEAQEKAKQKSHNKRQYRLLYRTLACADMLDLRTRGYVQLSDKMLEYLRISQDRSLTLVGMGDGYFEIWDSVKFSEQSLAYTEALEIILPEMFLPLLNKQPDGN